VRFRQDKLAIAGGIMVLTLGTGFAETITGRRYDQQSVVAQPLASIL
jgi:hypothetical protein